MARKASTFRKSDITRAVEAVVAAVPVARVEIEGGKISVIAREAADCSAVNGNAWDRAMEEISKRR